MLNEDILNLLDNKGVLLYLLREEGAKRFDEIVEILNPYEEIEKELGNLDSSKNDQDNSYLKPRAKIRHVMSRGTISKWLKYLRNPSRSYIEQFLEFDKITQRDIRKYRLTNTGRTIINTILIKENVHVNPDHLSLIYNPVREYFFEKLGLDPELNMPNLLKMITRIDNNLFIKLGESEELYRTLLFIYQNMLEFSINQDTLRFFAIDMFCQTYGVSQVEIQYYLEKVLELEMGFYLVEWEEHYLFFHKEDLIGAVIFNLTENALEKEIIRKSLNLKPRIEYEVLASEICGTLIEMKLIRPNLKHAFNRYIEAFLVLQARKRGLTRLDIVEYWPILNKLLQGKYGVEGIENSKAIFAEKKDNLILRLILKYIPN